MNGSTRLLPMCRSRKKPLGEEKPLFATFAWHGKIWLKPGRNPAKTISIYSAYLSEIVLSIFFALWSQLLVQFKGTVAVRDIANLVHGQ